ncbi:hypothetical protein WICMUC_002722 [Wickerhamomyces mucosus]|uniref:tRNA-splicing endonuclease subunit Sen15 domain-containing protein n=1 Tax=Wickerhamomyces mucosus TaxID=1378264 RepID=A0A9P8PN95_9ASCO|nr:hypothetical protein WICMUC_002722 [Wickerhamomyces mucosus]
MNQNGLLGQVKQNLLHYNLWSDISEIKLPNYTLIQGKPKEPLSSAAESHNEYEIIYPIKLTDSLTPKQLNQIFEELKLEKGNRLPKIICAILNDDGTIVYYNIYNGLIKPKKN